MDLVEGIGIDGQEVLPQRLDLPLADLVDEVLLAVEVRRLDPVEVGDDQPADPRPGQGDRDVGAQAARAGDADRALPEHGQDGRIAVGEELPGEGDRPGFRQGLHGFGRSSAVSPALSMTRAILFGSGPTPLSDVTIPRTVRLDESPDERVQVDLPAVHFELDVRHVRLLDRDRIRSQIAAASSGLKTGTATPPGAGRSETTARSSSGSGDRRLGNAGPQDLDLAGPAEVLPALDEDDVGFGEQPRREPRQVPDRPPAQRRPAFRRDHGRAVGPGRGEVGRVLSLRVEREAVGAALEGRDPQPAPPELADEPDDEPRFAAPGETDDRDDPHRVLNSIGARASQSAGRTYCQTIFMFCGPRVVTSGLRSSFSSAGLLPMSMATR